MTNTAIGDLTEIDAPEYHRFFLRVLASDPGCFRISPADEKEIRLPTCGVEDSFTLGAYVDDRLAGVVSFEREGRNRERLRHKGLLFRMAVASDQRGRGLGRLLIQEVLTRGRKIPGMEQVILTVISGNTGAKKLYESYGFRTYGREPRAVKGSGGYLDEDAMVLFLHSGLARSTA
jgi:ribosomal protein S18 acetylase RimI-like enzyme